MDECVISLSVCLWVVILPDMSLNATFTLILNAISLRVSKSRFGSRVRLTRDSTSETLPHQPLSTSPSRTFVSVTKFSINRVTHTKKGFKSPHKMQHKLSAATLQKWSLGEEGREGREREGRREGGGVVGSFPPDIHHFSPTSSCCHRDGDYSIAGITPTACRVPFLTEGAEFS